VKITEFSTATALMVIILVATSSGSALTTIVNAEYDPPEWQIAITGLVEQPLNLSLAELVVMPQTSLYAPIVCVGPPARVVDEGNWTGVNLRSLLATAGVSPDAIKVAFHASDGYSTDLTIETAMSGEIILAYEKDGVPLNEMLRLVVPDKWGYKWISYVTVIELVDYDFLGVWESQGYPDAAVVGEEIPEFSSVIAFLTPLVLSGLFIFLMKKRGKILRV
jgi:DMSO/TMAO reductase YedYZ molybdopterin-dependent catalytic subunit